MTAMDTLPALQGPMPEIPRFDDGMVNLNELVRTLAEALVNEVMDAQADDACAEGNQRNGYRERRLLTSVGPITLRIPKLRRGTFFPDDLIDRYSRVDRAVVAAVAEMVASGVSTRKVERVARTLGADRMSASQASRICEALDATVSDLRERSFGGVRFPYLWIDATYVKCRDGGHVSSCAVATAIGAADTGHRALLGLEAVDEYTLKMTLKSAMPAEDWLILHNKYFYVLPQHLLLSHHGEPEFGAAVRPMCAESELLSMIDLIDSRMEIYKETMEETEVGTFSKRVFALDKKIYRHK